MSNQAKKVIKEQLNLVFEGHGYPITFNRWGGEYLPIRYSTKKDSYTITIPQTYTHDEGMILQIYRLMNLLPYTVVIRH
jgi:hypothetical protein